MKKNKILLVLIAIIFMSGGYTELQAQGRKAEKQYWKQIEKAEKNRNKQIREYRKQEKKYYKDYAKRLRRNGPPPWAKAYGYDARHHIYFSDYRAFYDPYRGGYVYINGGNWSFSFDIPSFMVNVNLGNARTRILRDIPVNRHPEDFYGDYDYWND